MIDGDHLEWVRVVYEDGSAGTTKVSENVWPNDKDSLFPLQAALGYSIAQTLFYAKRQLVVEGITDYWLLKAMSHRLKERSMETLGSDVVIVPAGGVNHLMPLAAMLNAHEVELRVLLDGDEPGKRKGKEVKDKLLLESFFVSNYCADGGLEIEDLFPEDLYLKAVGEAYPGPTFSLERSDRASPSVTKRVYRRIRSGRTREFEKWRPAKVIASWIQDGPDAIPPATLEAFSRLFAKHERNLEVSSQKQGRDARTRSPDKT